MELRPEDHQEEDSPRRPKDFEAQLFSGCTTIGVTSVIVLILVMWPWLLFEAHLVANLLKIIPISLGGTFLFGILVTLKYKLAGGTGFLGGSMAGSVFIFLRMKQMLLAAANVDMPQPDFPLYWVWAVPGLLFILAVVTVATLVPSKEPPKGV